MKTLLIVDDSTTIRNVLKTSMHNKYSIFEAENGEAALKIAGENKVDLFLLDVNMPIMNGIILTKKLREQTLYKTTPIIILTTETKPEMRQQGKEAGANGWVVKPCEPQQLLGIIQKMIGS
jgi:two-component system chemotaxis response regulator CheY